MPRWPFSMPKPPEPSRVTHSERILHQLTADHLRALTTTPAHLTQAERLLLYTLAFATRPRSYLEIGTLHGGSALLVAAAFDASDNPAPMVLVDPEPQITPEDWAQLEPRAILIEGCSPEVLERAAQVAGGAFDLVLVDGDHSTEGLLRDLEGLKAVVAVGAYLACHDAYHPAVRAALEQFMRRERRHYLDLGLLTHESPLEGEAVGWGGIRLLQRYR